MNTAPPAPSPLDRPLQKIIGKAAVPLEDRFGIRTVGDLLRHYPRRYDRMGHHTDLSGLRDGDQVTVLAQIARVETRARRTPQGNRGTVHRRPPLSITEITVTDGHRRLWLTFYNQKWRGRTLQAGQWGQFAGTLSTYRGRLQLVHPAMEILGDDADFAAVIAGGYPAAPDGTELIPVYPASEKLPSWKIASCVRAVLDVLGELDDPVPAGIRSRLGLPGLTGSLRAVHRPEVDDDWTVARRRLAFDEAFALQITLARRRADAAARPAVARPTRPDGLAGAFRAALPFVLTEGQREVVGRLSAELAAQHPMHRLLQGEVGSGKTVCALLAMLQVVDTGGQAALLAPTEVLAGQHYRSLRDLLGPYARAGELGAAENATGMVLLTGSLPAGARRRALAEVASGAAGIVIGTHALLSEGVEFNDLGLVVVDEQHRFGVEQRDALRSKSARPPHLLVMTATPIPRTVAMTVYGDLEVSTLRELPVGRVPIGSHVVPAAEKPRFLERAWARIREEVAAGHQAYVVCPRIGEYGADGDDAEEPDAAADLDADPVDHDPGGHAAPAARRPPLAVADIAPMLADGPLAGLRLGVLHGRLPADEKDAVMRAFAAGALDVLVATTVVEVGVDIPNATVMAVLDADRFGISQLHQLRGRIGRGTAPGICLLVTDAPAGTPARDRLDAVAATLDGFELAELDLRQRREGEVLGATQSGRRRSIKLLDVLSAAHRELIAEARQEANALVAEDPALTAHPALAGAVDRMVAGDRAEYLEKG
jgi:ATP-dependent DNA helicase RecG